MADKFPLFEISADRDGDVYVDRPQTLRDLLNACRTAEEAGFPLDAQLQHGFMPNQLIDAVYVEKPTDFKRLPFGELKRLATALSSTGEQARAWSEIQRRVEGFGMPGDHDG